MLSICPLSLNPIRTGIFSEHVSLEGGGLFFIPRVYSFVNKPRMLKFGAQLKMDKIYHRKQYSS